MSGSSSPPPTKRPRVDDSSTANGTAGVNKMSSHTLPPLSLSILGVEPMDEFIKEIADFVHHFIMTRPPGVEGNIEVEAKIGIIRDKNTSHRLSLPLLVETILVPEFASSDIQFESNMSMHQHKHFNSLLNELMIASSQPGHHSSPVEYIHRHLLDTFYPGEGRDKVRVTRDEKTNQVVDCVRKIRLGDLNVYSPKRMADWRVSVNLEVPSSHPVGSPIYSRRKDRLSYSHEEFVIDLTQVKTQRDGVSEQQHELEIEISRSSLLLALAARRNDPNAPEHERNAFDELIRAFVNNARILCRNADGGWQ